MKLRDATAGDAAAIALIYAHHVLHGAGTFEEDPPPATEIASRMAAVQAQGRPYLVAERDGRAAGFAYAVQFRPRPAYRFTVEDSVYVAADAVGQGVGRALLTELIARCEGAGMRQMVGIIGDSANLASIRLHEALGFRRIGTAPAMGWKHGRWVDVVWMQRALGEGETSSPA
ncbi:MAG TPA: GNAT family N-acetyltransferase [Caulobacteraceae bacterium]|nr:GNAT family N-acetyltransferase [Caulobacteraceae bacterium]